MRARHLAWSPAWPLLAGLVASYAAASLASAAMVMRPWSDPLQWLGIAAATTCMHFGYGLGFARGLWDFGVVRRGPAAAATRLTR